jgi:hypothetical protein
MNHHHPCRNLGEGDRPIDRRIAAAGDDDALAAERLAPCDEIEDALALVVLDPVERRAIGPKGADPRGNDHGLSEENNAATGLDPETTILNPGESHDLLAEMINRRERRGLLFESRDQRRGIDRGMAGDIVDRFFRIERAALPAGHVERVDHMAFETEHAAFEYGKEPDWASADDRDIRLLHALRHSLLPRRFARKMAA